MTQVYSTLLAAIADTHAVIHSGGGPAHPGNGFTVRQVSDGRYKVEGECWTFYVRHGGQPGAGWIVELSV